MELQEESLDGHWSTNNNTGMEFFIINDAIFTKLCILGDDVEPCFEGARITAPEVSTSFTKMDDNFKRTLFTMMKDLEFALKGGYEMELENKDVENEVETPTQEEVVETKETSIETSTEEISTEAEDISIEATQPSQEEYAAEETNEEELKEIIEENSTEDTVENDSEEEIVEEVNDYSLLEKELEDLKASYAEMEAKNQELMAFKESIDNEKKDALIKEFYMLSDEDKKDVIENKSKYSLEEIEAKLSVICVRKKVNFDLENSNENEDKIEDEVVTTYSLNNEESNDAIPEWLKALKNTRDSRE